MDSQEMAVCEAIRDAVKGARPKRTVKDIADAIQISPHVLTNFMLRRTVPDEESVRRLRKELGLPKTWPHVPVTRSEGKRVSLAGTPLAPIKIVGSASAGFGISNVDVQDDQVFVPERLAQIGGLGWLVDGESMMPYLEPGDVAIFREGHQPRRGFTYLLKSPDAEFRVKSLAWDQGQWMMNSLNPSFAPEPLGDHQLIGFLIGWYRTKGSRETMDSDPNGLVL